MTFIAIKRGCHILTGKWLPKVWIVNLRGRQSMKVKTLAAAKALAVEHGASGQWIRTVEPTAPRGAGQVVYRDAKGGVE